MVNKKRRAKPKTILYRTKTQKVYKKKITGKGIKKITRPYINKENKLMLGEGKKYKKQKGGALLSVASALAPFAVNLISKIFS